MTIRYAPAINLSGSSRGRADRVDASGLIDFVLLHRSCRCIFRVGPPVTSSTSSMIEALYT